MPSIFTRARTTSSKNLPKPPPEARAHATSPVPGSGYGPTTTDEFGRVRSRGAGAASPQHHPHFQLNTNTNTPRRDVRSRADSSFDNNTTDYGALMQEGFLPTGLGLGLAAGAEGAEDPLVEPSGHPMQKQSQQSQMYGYLGYATNVVLGVEDVTRLVEVVADELGRRGECFCLPLLFGLPRFLFLTFFFYSFFSF